MKSQSKKAPTNVKCLFFCKSVAFLLILLSFFSIAEDVFIRKDNWGKYQNYKAQSSIDILILGNSHANRGIGSKRIKDNLEEEYSEKVTVFNYNVDGVCMQQILYLFQELLEHQTPNLVILETYVFRPLGDEERDLLAHLSFDPLPLNKNKVEAINYCVYKNKWQHYIPFIKYHTRWKELERDDFKVFGDCGNWINSGTITWGDRFPEQICENPGDNYFNKTIPGPTEYRELQSQQQECLDQFIALLRENDVQLLFVSVPYKRQKGLNSIEQIKINNYLRDNYVDNRSIQMLDMNCMWKELDFDYKDLYDEGHVNGYGAEKTTKRIIQYLKENYDLTEIIK